MLVKLLECFVCLHLTQLELMLSQLLVTSHVRPKRGWEMKWKVERRDLCHFVGCGPICSGAHGGHFRHVEVLDDGPPLDSSVQSILPLLHLRELEHRSGVV